MIGLTWLVLRK